MPASRVYAAEDQWAAVLDRGGTVDFFGSRLDVAPQRRLGDLEAIRAYARWAVDLPAVRAAYPAAGPVAVRERSGQRRAHYEPDPPMIAIPLREGWATRESVVLHELAHHLACSAAPAGRGRRDWHGRGFRQAMCLLVEAALGPSAALLLRAGYEEAGLPTVVPA